MGGGGGVGRATKKSTSKPRSLGGASRIDYANQPKSEEIWVLKTTWRLTTKMAEGNFRSNSDEVEDLADYPESRLSSSSDQENREGKDKLLAKLQNTGRLSGSKLTFPNSTTSLPFPPSFPLQNNFSDFVCLSCSMKTYVFFLSSVRPTAELLSYQISKQVIIIISFNFVNISFRHSYGMYGHFLE